MPDSNGNFKGISVPELPWLDGKEQRRPVHRSSLTAAHMLDGATRFNPDGHEIWDRDGKLLNAYETEVSEARKG